MGMFRSQPEGSISDSVSAEVFKISPKHDHRQWLLLPYGCKQAVAGRHGGTGANRLLHSTYCTGKYEIPWSWEFKMVDPAKKTIHIVYKCSSKIKELVYSIPLRVVLLWRFGTPSLGLKEVPRILTGNWLDARQNPTSGLERGWQDWQVRGCRLFGGIEHDHFSQVWTTWLEIALYVGVWQDPTATVPTWNRILTETTNHFWLQQLQSGILYLALVIWDSAKRLVQDLFLCSQVTIGMIE